MGHNGAVFNTYTTDGFYIMEDGEQIAMSEEYAERITKVLNRDHLFDELMEALKVTTAMLNTDIGQVTNKHHVKSMNSLIARAEGKEVV